MERQTLNISIVIPTLNRISSLKRTFSFISKSPELPREVIVIDQSSNNIATKVKDLCAIQNMPVKYIYLETPSLTRARNMGLDACENDIVLFMDDDVDIAPNTLKNLLSLFKDDSISLIGGIDGASPKKRFSPLGFLFFQSSFFKRREGHVSKAVYGVFPQDPHEQTPTEWAMGFFFAIRKSLAKKWGMKFDENLKYYAYAEDLDFTHRYFLKSKKENLMCIISTLVTVTHNISSEYRLPQRTRTFLEICHRRYIMSKLTNSFAENLIMIWSDIGTAIRRIIKGEPFWDVFKAIIFAIKYNRDIKNGIFHYDKFI